MSLIPICSYLGMLLTINLEDDEYITNFASGFGLRLVIHEPGTYPFPAAEGLTLSPGFETSIGLKMVGANKLVILLIQRRVRGHRRLSLLFLGTYSHT